MAVALPFSAVAIEALPTAPSGLRSGAIQPNECAAGGGEVLEFLLHRDRRRHEILRLVHPHQIGAEIEHQRRLDVARMDAVLRFDRVVHAVRQTEPAPVRGDREHRAAHAQFARRGRDHRGVAAVRIGEDELAQAGAMHALADLDQHAQQRVGRQCQRAGRQDVLVRLADRLHRQHQHADVVGQPLPQHREHAVRDRGVGHHRQMRPVLLGRRDRQNRNRVGGVETFEILRGQFAPEKCTSRHVSSPLPLLQASAMPLMRQPARAAAWPCAVPRPPGSGRYPIRRARAPEASARSDGLRVRTAAGAEFRRPPPPARRRAD